MIVLFTDFGIEDSYVGQLHAVFARDVPGVPVIDLLHTVPCFDVKAGAFLLASFASQFPHGSVFVGVVDPGVGAARAPVIVKADGRWFVGPDNGLFSVLASRAQTLESWTIRWKPAQLSESFHGRDLFAPVAAMLARGQMPDAQPAALTSFPWPDDLPQVIYIDRYGNAVTGLRGQTVETNRGIRVGRRVLTYARVFSDVPVGEAFWYINANGLIEIAVREGSAARRLRLRVGASVYPLREQ